MPRQHLYLLYTRLTQPDILHIPESSHYLYLFLWVKRTDPLPFTVLRKPPTLLHPSHIPTNIALIKYSLKLSLLHLTHILHNLLHIQVVLTVQLDPPQMREVFKVKYDHLFGCHFWLENYQHL